VALQQTVEQTVTALGYDLLEVQRLHGGVLRVTIDMPWPPPEAAQQAPGDAPERVVSLDDCEKVSRQLQFVLEVAGEDYQRLEVSSPGIDRVLRHAQDFARFAGQVVDITLKEPMGAAAQGQVDARRKKFRGVLQRAASGAAAQDGAPADGERWQIVFSDAPPPRPGQRVGKKRAAAQAQAVQVLGFALHELREARLAPVVDFKGRADRAA